MENKGPNLKLFAILTTVTVFVWIGTGVYQIINKRTLEDIPANVLAPIDPSLDTSSLNDIEKRRFFEGASVPSRNIVVSSSSAALSPTPIPSSPAPTLSASQSAQPTQSP